MTDTIRVHIRLPRDQFIKLMDESKQIGNPVSSIIRVAINNYLLENEK